MRASSISCLRRAVLPVTFVLAAASGFGASKGPDAGGYTASDAVVYSLVDLSSGGGAASILAGTDDGVAPLTMPFAFQFYGHSYSVVCVSSNGALYFVSSAGACGGFSDFANADLTSTPTPNDLAAALPFWSDLTFQVPGGGSVLYQTTGAAGSRRFVVQWNNAYPQGSPNPVTFQVVLTEGTNKLLFQYKTAALGDANPATNGKLATVGIRNAGALTNQQQLEWSFDAPVIADNSALQFAAASGPVTGDVNGDGIVNCTDLNIIKAAFNKRTGQPGFDARADVNRDGIVNVLDLTIVSRAIPAGVKCP